MRTRDEVLREFGAAELTRLLPPVVAESIERMADRIRELEAQLVSNANTLVSGEPVAWALYENGEYYDAVSADAFDVDGWCSRKPGRTKAPLYAHPTTPTSDEGASA